jgi:Ca2+-binding RTX toxin-like protein
LNGDDGHDKLHGGNHVDRLWGNDGPDWLYGGADSDNLFGGADDDVLCENQANSSGLPLQSNTAARNYLSGGSGTGDILDHHAYTFYQDPSTKPLFGGDQTIEYGFYPIEIQQSGLDIPLLHPSMGARLGDHDPNRLECATLISMFGY